jgi:hypothetical protein
MYEWMHAPVEAHTPTEDDEGGKELLLMSHSAFRSNIGVKSETAKII